MEPKRQENRTYSVAEVLQITLNQLSGIQVPVGLIESIGVPILDSIDNLRNCLQALSKNNSKPMSQDFKDESENAMEESGPVSEKETLEE